MEAERSRNANHPGHPQVSREGVESYVSAASHEIGAWSVVRERRESALRAFRNEEQLASSGKSGIAAYILALLGSERTPLSSRQIIDDASEKLRVEATDIQTSLLELKAEGKVRRADLGQYELNQ